MTTTQKRAVLCTGEMSEAKLHDTKGGVVLGLSSLQIGVLLSGSMSIPAKKVPNTTPRGSRKMGVGRTTFTAGKSKSLVSGWVKGPRG